MANHFPLPSIFYLLLLLATTLTTLARILDEITPPFTLPPETTVVPPPTTRPSGQIPAISAFPTTNVAPEIPPTEEPIADIPIPATATTVSSPEITPTEQAAAPAKPPTADIPNAADAATTAATSAGIFSFFMHDILGGSHPSGRTVAGIVANSDANSLPFSKPSNPIFPINGGVPLTTINGVIINNYYPFPNTLQTNGNNAVAGAANNQAFVTAGQLPQGLTLQQLMFGSVTVVDDELTEGQELGSGVVGRAEGIYVTSSSDGSSHTVLLTAAFYGGHGHELDDTISFFGVHRTATPVSHIAIVGGTGKYENAKGYAAIEALPHQDQHTTDGIETITHFTVYFTP